MFKKDHLPIVFTVFFLGWSSYSLRLVSILKLLGSESLSIYPQLMIIQGFSLLFSVRIFKAVSRNRSNVFNFLTLFFGCLIVYFGLTFREMEFYQPKYDLFYNGVIFLLSSANLVAFEITGKMMMTRRVSLLRNPKFTQTLVLVMELGVLSATAVNYLNAKYHLIAHHQLALAPFAIAAPFILYFSFFKKDKYVEAAKAESIPKETKLNVWRLPYFKLLLGLVSITLITKCLGDFSLLMGINSLHKSSDMALSGVYSKVIFFQTMLSLSILGITTYRSQGSSSWLKSYKVYYVVQSLSFLSLFILPVPTTMLSAGILRRIGKRGLLEKANAVLDDSIPSSSRFHVKEAYLRYSQAIAFMFLGAFSYAYIHHFFDSRLLWAIAFIAPIAGYKIASRLFKTFSGFHAENVINFHESPSANFQAVESAYALAAPEAKGYQRIFVDVIKRQPKSILKRALIFALGEMGNEKSINALIQIYHDDDREDSRAHVLQALLKFKSYQVDLFFQKTLVSMITNPSQKGVIQLSLCSIIAKRNSHATIMNTLSAHEKFNSSPELLPNIIQVIGFVANSLNDQWLYNFLLQYLKRTYHPKIRQQAIIALYPNRKFRPDAQKAIAFLERSPDAEERALIANIAQNLELTEYTDYLKNLDRLLMSENSEVLVALSSLGEKEAIGKLIAFITQQDQDSAMAAISQFHSIQNKAGRHILYYELINEYPDLTPLFLERLKHSGRDFNEDLEIIIAEAAKVGLKLTIDLYGFHSNEVHSRRCA
jgi:HEAT repeat protein